MMNFRRRVIVIGILLLTSWAGEAQRYRWGAWHPAPGYLELPKYDAEYGPRFMVKRYAPRSGRTYCVYYDMSKRVPLWVAYPLNRELMGRHDYNPGWKSDPDLAFSWQGDLTLGYSSGMRPAHLIPPRDRSTSVSAAQQTALYTNAAPMNPRFMKQLWIPLEDKIRVWASRCDTLYVISGLVPGSGYVNDSGGHRVNAPKAYYKALLRKNGDTYSTCAFYLPHGGGDPKSSARFNQYVVSLSELERRLGYKLFVNVEKRIGKSQFRTMANTNPASDTWWWR